MKTICTAVYTYAELSDSAKQTAISNCFDINTDTDWWGGVYEDFYQICDILGIGLKERNKHEKCVWFSGFSSQGSGACFEARYAYKAGSCKAIRDYCNDKGLFAIADNLKAIQKSNFYQLRAETSQHGRYMQMSVSVERDDCKEMTTNAEAGLEQALYDLNAWLFKSLEAEHDYLTSEEAILETIEANEYHFTEEGELA